MSGSEAEQASSLEGGWIVNRPAKPKKALKLQVVKF
jgi:hypothetical protein